LLVKGEVKGPDSVDVALAGASRDVDLSVLGDRIRNLRAAAGLTQSQLGGSDASIAYISRIEAGTRRPDLKLLTAIAGRLGSTVEELLYGVSRDRRAELRLALDFAELALRSGNASEALSKSTEVLDAASTTSAADLTLDAAMVKALALEGLGHLDDAIIDLEVLVGDESTTAQWVRAAIALTRCYRESGDLVRATDAGETAMVYLRRVGLDATDEGIQLVVTLASVYNERGDTGHAIRLCRAAAAKAEELDSPQAKAAAYWNASIFESEQGRTEAAIPLAKHALALLDTGSDNRNLARLHSQLGMFLLSGEQPDPAAAKESLERAAIELEWSAATVIERGYNAVALARSVLLLGNPDRAEDLLAHIGDAATSAPLLAADCELLQGQIHGTRGQADKARTSYLNAVHLLTSIGADKAAAQMWLDLGALLDGLGDTDAAKTAYLHAASSTGLVTPRRPIGAIAR